MATTTTACIKKNQDGKIGGSQGRMGDTDSGTNRATPIHTFIKERGHPADGQGSAGPKR